jgi:hypothetical protein
MRALGRLRYDKVVAYAEEVPMYCTDTSQRHFNTGLMKPAMNWSGSKESPVNAGRDCLLARLEYWSLRPLLRHGRFKLANLPQPFSLLSPHSFLGLGRQRTQHDEPMQNMSSIPKTFIFTYAGFRRHVFRSGDVLVFFSNSEPTSKEN